MNITTPFTQDVIDSLKAGDRILLSGYIYTARDAAHKCMVEELSKPSCMPPFAFEGQAVFYAGPTPPRPGKVVGSIGPTTSSRMDIYAPELIGRGLKVMIGKGKRSKAVKDAIVEHGGLYLSAIGGVAALMSGCVKASEIVAYEELGTEAVRRLLVTDMPLIVAVDAKGNDCLWG